MDRARNLIRTSIMASAVLAVCSQGCATRGYVRARLESLRRSFDQDSAEQAGRIHAELTQVRNSSQEALARAQLASGQAGEARDLALGKAGYQEVARYPVFFATDASALDETATTVLEEAAQGIQAHPEYLVDICGYTDRTGSAGHNLVLGQRRAEAVLRFLSQRTPGMLSRYAAVSYGAEAPVGDQSSGAGRAQNRRVVVSLVTRTRLPEAVTQWGQSGRGEIPRSDPSVAVGRP